MILTKEIFNNSTYYIAPGFDFEPLCRFSNICTNFIYANLYYSKQEVLAHLNTDLKYSNELEVISIKEYDDFDELTYFELHHEYQSHLRDALNSFSEMDKKNYRKAFVPALSEKQWMIEADIRRKGLDRNLKLYYFTGEGLASYIALSQNGMYPPKVLCTIQTDILESANGLMTRFLKQTKELPFIWVRGIEEDLDRFSNAFNKDEIYNNIALSFNFHWFVNASYANQFHFNMQRITKRLCKAFITDATKHRIAGQQFKKYNKASILYGNIEDLLPINDKKKLVLIPKKLEKLLPTANEKLHISFWDKVTDFYKKVSLAESLKFIENIDKKLEFDSIYFTVNGTEDEGVLLDIFLQKDHNAEMYPVVRDLFDLYDLRENGSN
jgi:hypothetical protein